MHVKWLGCLALIVNPIRAQTVVRESASQYDAAPRLILAVERRWCSEPESSACDFKGISQAVSLSDGGIAASYFRGPIRVFDLDGKFRREVSRRGEGPGEYRYVHSLRLTTQDQLTWYDPILRRTTTVSSGSEGNAVTSAVDQPASVEGAFVASRGVVFLEVPPADAPAQEVDASFRLRRTGDRPQLLASVRRPSRFVRGVEIPLAPPLFSPNSLADVNARGDVIHSHGRTYEIDVVSSGRKPWRLSVAAPGRLILKSELDSAISEELRNAGVGSIGALSPQDQRRIRAVGRMHPAIEELRLLRDGTIWIRPVAPRGNTQARWDVFDRNGKRLGYTLLARNATITDGTASWIVAVELSADDVPTIVRYSVRGPR